MEKQIQRKRRWRLVLTIVTILALIGLVLAARRQILDTIKNLGEVNGWALLLMFPLQYLNYHSYTKMYQTFFSFLGQPVEYKKMFRTNLELNFINNVFPSGGVSGFSYFGLRMRDLGVTAGKATLVQVMRFVLLFVSFQVLLFVGLLLLAVEGRANSVTILIAGSLATLLFVGTLLLGFIVGSEKRINEFFTFLPRIVNKVVRYVKHDESETIDIARVRRLFTELHQNYILVKGNYDVLRRAFVFALLANATEILTVYVVYIAFGQFVNPGAVILAYAIANFAGLVSVLPGGVGVYEGLMTAVLASAGVSPVVSLPVTVMYRILNMAIQLTPGAYLYHKTLHAEDNNQANS